MFRFASEIASLRVTLGIANAIVRVVCFSGFAANVTIFIASVIINMITDASYVSATEVTVSVTRIVILMSYRSVIAASCYVTLGIAAIIKYVSLSLLGAYVAFLVTKIVVSMLGFTNGFANVTINVTRIVVTVFCPALKSAFADGIASVFPLMGRNSFESAVGSVTSRIADIIEHVSSTNIVTTYYLTDSIARLVITVIYVIGNYTNKCAPLHVTGIVAGMAEHVIYRTLIITTVYVTLVITAVVKLMLGSTNVTAAGSVTIGVTVVVVYVIGYTLISAKITNLITGMVV